MRSYYAAFYAVKAVLAGKKLRDYNIFVRT